MADTLTQLNAHYAALQKRLVELQKKRSEEKWWKRHDENKAIREVEKQMKNLLKRIKQLEKSEDKHDYLETAAENGLNPRGDMWNGLANMTGSIANAATGIVGIRNNAQVKNNQIKGRNETLQNLGSNNQFVYIAIGVVALFLILKRK